MHTSKPTCRKIAATARPPMPAPTTAMDSFPLRMAVRDSISAIRAQRALRAAFQGKLDRSRRPARPRRTPRRRPGTTWQTAGPTLSAAISTRARNEFQNLQGTRPNASADSDPAGPQACAIHDAQGGLELQPGSSRHFEKTAYLLVESTRGSGPGSARGPNAARAKADRG